MLSQHPAAVDLKEREREKKKKHKKATLCCRSVGKGA